MAKRETNKERRASEDRRRTIYKMAIGITGSICTRRYFSSLPDGERKRNQRAQEVMDLLIGHSRTHLDAEWVESQSIENIVKALRLAADILEGKEDGRSFSDHDERMFVAFCEASNRVKRDHPHRVIYNDADATHLFGTADPTFSEFIEVYREQNPKVRVEERALRRSLRRLGLPIRPSRRGRPARK